MNMQKKFVFTLTVVTAFFYLTPMTFAENLIYSGRRANEFPTQDQAALVDGASSPAVPVDYGVGGNTNYQSYNNFMQSPYSTGVLSQQYPSMQQPGAASSNMTGKDSKAVSEVSPFSQYSPYMEISGEGSDYKLGIDDVVTIMVRNQPDFSGRFAIDPEGNIQYNFVGNVKADGKTKDELKADITEKLKKFVRFPEVAVMISEYRSKAVYVFGFVNRPGKYAMRGNKITVKEAIVAAGLLRMDGSLKNVYIVRPSEKTKDGKPWTKKVNLKKLMVKGDSKEDFVLEPGDAIMVNQRHFDKFIDAYTRIVGPVFQTAALYEVAYGNDPNGVLRKD